MLQKYFTYIAICSDGSFYTGSTNNIQNREYTHNIGYGSNYTKQRRPVKIIYFEEFKTRKEAYARENQIKGWTRKKKIFLINKKITNN